MSTRIDAGFRASLWATPRRACLLCALIFASIPICANAATYYVSPSGKDTNAGTSTAPFLTIQHAADLVKAGDTVIVRQGVYAGFVMGWDTPTAGTATAPIVFKADLAELFGKFRHKNSFSKDG